jgi:hypothetical protein
MLLGMIYSKTKFVGRLYLISISINKKDGARYVDLTLKLSPQIVGNTKGTQQGITRLFK